MNIRGEEVSPATGCVVILMVLALNILWYGAILAGGIWVVVTVLRHLGVI